MKRMLLIVFVFTLLIGGVFTASAQEPEFEACEDDRRDALADAIVTVSEFIRDGTDEELEDALLVAQVLLGTYRAQCTQGLIFTSENYPNGVTAPITIPDGIYTLRLESDGSVDIDMTELQGRCGDTFIYVDGNMEEEVSEVESCVMVMDIEADDDASEWTLTYEPIIFTGD